MSEVRRTEGLALSWRAARDLPDGPVTLWMAVFSDTRQLLGCAPMRGCPSWQWRGGRLGIDYGAVPVTVQAEGRCRHAFIIAVAGGHYLPVFRVGLGMPQRVAPGTVMTLVDGLISVVPEAGSDPFASEQ